MTITITATTRIVTVETSSGDVSARVWEGTTERGVTVYETDYVRARALPPRRLADPLDPRMGVV